MLLKFSGHLVVGHGTLGGAPTDLEIRPSVGGAFLYVGTGANGGLDAFALGEARTAAPLYSMTYATAVVSVMAAADLTDAQRLYAAAPSGDPTAIRFGGVQALAVTQTPDGQVYVAAGGADDGISLFALIPGGHLVHLESMANDVGERPIPQMPGLRRQGISTAFATRSKSDGPRRSLTQRPSSQKYCQESKMTSKKNDAEFSKSGFGEITSENYVNF